MEELGSILGGLENFLTDREVIVTKMSEGDLTKDVTLASDRDTFGKAFKNMVNNLREIISQVLSSGEQVAHAAGQVSLASQTLSQGASEQASSLEEISSSLTEMAAQTRNSAENAVPAVR